MRTTIIALSLLLTAGLQAQQSLSLVQCQQMARENAPRLRDAEVIRGMGEVNLDIKQNLYDGGMTGRRKTFEEAQTAADLQQVEVDLYGIKGRVNAYYFPVLVLQENFKNLEIHMENLDAREQSMQSAVDQGALLESELKIIQVEKLKNHQRMLELESQKRALLNALEVLCGMEIEDSVYLELPDFELSGQGELNRPEHLLFDLKHNSLEAGKELAGSKRMPVLYAYGQTGYGKPGYNMMSGDWDHYYMVGAGLHWNIWDWNSTKKDQQVLSYKQQVLQNQRRSFDQELEGRLVQEEEKIEQFRQTMLIEEEVLGLQEEISAAAATRLAQGTMTATEYITELNKESMARIRLVSYRVQLMQAMAAYLLIQGNL